MAVIQSISMLFLIFVSFCKCPDFLLNYAENSYVDYMPWVSMLVFLATFVIIPIVVIIQTFANMSAIQESLFNSCLWIYCISALVTVLLWIPTQLLGIFLQGFNVVGKRKMNRAFKGSAKNWKELTDEVNNPEVSKQVKQKIDEEYNYLKATKLQEIREENAKKFYAKFGDDKLLVEIEERGKKIEEILAEREANKVKV